MSAVEMLGKLMLSVVALPLVHCFCLAVLWLPEEKPAEEKPAGAQSAADQGKPQQGGGVEQVVNADHSAGKDKDDRERKDAVHGQNHTGNGQAHTGVINDGSSKEPQEKQSPVATTSPSSPTTSQQQQHPASTAPATHVDKDSHPPAPADVTPVPQPSVDGHARDVSDASPVRKPPSPPPPPSEQRPAHFTTSASLHSGTQQPKTLHHQNGNAASKEVGAGPGSIPG